MIRIEHVAKSYGDHKVIQDLSLTIPDGKITAFIGPNGAGKSTLLNMMSRLIPMDSGKIFIDEKEIREWNTKELAKKIAILKQSNTLNIRLKVVDLVSFGRFPYSQGRLNQEDWQYINQAMDYLNLMDIKDQYLDELSGGQRQRALIAMVLAQNTDYILLDEPLNNLDIKHSIEMMKILRDLITDFHKTIIMVVHDINIAATYSDYIVAMKDGSIHEVGDVKRIIDKNVLDKIYEMNFRIESIDDRRICIYY